MAQVHENESGWRRGTQSDVKKQGVVEKAMVGDVIGSLGL